jgi:hypothetical protein
MLHEDGADVGVLEFDRALRASDLPLKAAVRSALLTGWPDSSASSIAK